jgi:hypothetical protein
VLKDVLSEAQIMPHFFSLKKCLSNLINTAICLPNEIIER